MEANLLIHVAAGALQDAEGRVLVTRRHDHQHQGGLWEFPGGKLEPGESLFQGLDRELHEELGVRVLASEPLIRVRHDYGDRHVLLDVHRVTRFAGQPRGREGQPLRWQHPAAMRPEAFPAADRPIITALRLPDRMLITGADPADSPVFLARLARALEGGVRLVQLRAPALDTEGYGALARSAGDLCRRAGAVLLLNPPRSGDRVPADGLHLTGHRLMALRRRPERPGLVGASCHDAGQLRQAAALGLDYALLSPVKATASHPDAEPLGWERFAELVDAVPLPVYALGGMGVGDIPAAKAHGGQGIAAIRGLWPG